MSKKKEEAKKEFEKRLEKSSLSKEEIQELVALEFEEEVGAIERQIRRYYLLLKKDSPEKAESMLCKIEIKKSQQKENEQDILDICSILSKYFSGFIIFWEGEIYEKGKLDRNK